MNPVTQQLDQLEATERQLLVFARDLNQLYHAERGRGAALDAACQDMVQTLALVVEAKDPSTRAHLQRAHDYAVALAGVVDPALADDRQLRFGFLLHDVGKIGVPEAILTKAGPLDVDEWAVMRTHPELGERIVASISSLLGPAVAVIRSHHEHWDGGGYPDGLRGEEIPLPARVFSVCDAFDAMTSDRPYRRALPLEVAFDQILQGSGTQFDPQMVDAFGQLAPLLPALHASLHTGVTRTEDHAPSPYATCG
ncbi:MAG TPA: HD-GYP domain-containing protein [Actinomycetota bacterium]